MTPGRWAGTRPLHPVGYLTVSEKCPALGTDKDRQTHLHTGHLQVPRSQLSCR